MSKTKLVHDRIKKILNEQNSELDVKVRILKLSNTDVQIHIKTPYSFLQINNLSEVMDNTFYNKACFIIDNNCILNIQSKRHEYNIETGSHCSLYSFYLNKHGIINARLGKSTTFIYKGPHNIKTNIDCRVENAIKG